MPDPLVVVTMRQFKAQLLAREVGQMQVMARHWYEVEKRLGAQIELLAQDIAARGGLVSQGKWARLDRYRELLTQASVEFERYAGWADSQITAEQGRLARLGIAHSEQAIKTAGVTGNFNRLPVSAVENMVGLAGDGSPLTQLLTQRIVRDANGLPLPGVLEKMQTTFTNATAQGWNPRKTAKLIKDDLSGGLQKALEIARTEQLRVYRQASVQQYEESGVVKGHKRLCAHDVRTCLGCLADEGTIYPVNVPISDHPKGRCTSVPVLIDGPEIEFETAEKWIERLPEDQQRKIMGEKYHELWKSGTPFKDFVTKTQNATWGESLGPTPLKKLGVVKGGASGTKGMGAAVLRQREVEIINLTDHEEGILLDADGNIISDKAGGKDFIRWSDEELAKAKGGILTHNHPSGTSLSRPDIDVLFEFDLGSIRAVGVLDNQRVAYSMTPDKTLREYVQSSYSNKGRIMYAIGRTEREVRTKFETLIHNKQLTVAEANAKHWHEVWTRAQQRISNLGHGDLGYSREIIP